MKKRKRIFTEPSEFFYTILENEISYKIEENHNKATTENIYNNHSKYFKIRQKSKKICTVKGCENEKIQSHSISKSSVLKNISRNSHVYSPRVKDKIIMMEKIGVKKQASVFHYFCISHDTEYFSELDKIMPQKFNKPFFQQLILRTLSREIYCRERNLSMTIDTLSQLNSDFERIKEETISNFNANSPFSTAKILDISDNRFNYHQQKKELEEELIHEQINLQHLQEYSKKDSNILQAFIVGKTLPVAFSGITGFIKNNKRTTIVINCLPYKNKTLLVLYFMEEDESIIQSEILSKYDLDNDDSLLKLIEVLSVNGSDNIFFDIQYWDKLDKKIQEKYILDFSKIEETDPRNNLKYTFLKWDY